MQYARHVVRCRQGVVAVNRLHRDVSVNGVEVKVARHFSVRHFHVLPGDHLRHLRIVSVCGHINGTLDHWHVHGRIRKATVRVVNDRGVITRSGCVLRNVYRNHHAKDRHRADRSPFRDDSAHFRGSLYQVNRAAVGVPDVAGTRAIYHVL